MMTTLPPEQVHNTKEDLTLILPTFSNAILKDSESVEPLLNLVAWLEILKIIYYAIRILPNAMYDTYIEPRAV